MNRAELVKSIVANKKSGIETKAGADRVIEAILDGIKSGLKKDEAVSLVGFGTFKVKRRAARVGRNPRTGESVQVAASKTVRFKASPELKKTV